jgi:CHAT domain-containing protein/tetratricopeptide (TPR) repeat protein
LRAALFIVSPASPRDLCNSFDNPAFQWRPAMPRRIERCLMQWRSFCHAHPRHLALFVSALLFSGSIAAASARSISSAVGEAHPAQREATAQEVRVLEPGKPLERALAGGETHAYRLTLTSGQHLLAVVEQRGIDVVVAVLEPDGKQVANVDSPSRTQGPEPISVVAKVSGDYRLEVRAAEKDAAAGRYEVRIAELREAMPKDRSRVAAQAVLTEGRQLYAQGTAEARRQVIEKYAAALPLWREAGDRRGEAETLIGSGWVYYELGERQKAIECYHQALPLWREVGAREGEAVTLNRLGIAYTLSDEREKALDYLGQALSIFRAVGDRRAEADVLSGIGSLYNRWNEPPKAIEYHHQVLRLRRATGDRWGEAITLNNIGVAYGNLGDRQKALDYFQQALPLYRAVGNRRSEAYTLHSIAAVHLDRGEYQKSLDYLSQALPIRRATGDKFGEALTLQEIGIAYRWLGEPQRALDYGHQALALFRTANNRREEARTLTALGLIYSDLGERQQALDSLNQALLLSQAVGNRRGEATTLHNLGLVHGSLGDRQKALDYFQQALPLDRATGDRFREAKTLSNLGTAYYELGEKQKALDYYQQALPLHRALGDRIWEAHTLTKIARAHRDRGNLSEARAQLESALAIVESVRSGIASQQLRTSFFAVRQNDHEFYIDLLMRLHQEQPAAGYDRLALQASERARARSLLETLTEAQADIRQGVDLALLERERSLQQLLNGKAERLTRLLSGQATEEQKASASKELESLIAQHQEVQAQIRQSSPRYAALTQPQPLSAQEIQQQALDSDTLLLEYALGEERSFVWAVTPTSIASFELPRRAEIEAAAKRVYELMTKSNERAVMGQVELAAAALGQMLLGPVASRLGRKRLLIVADGALQYVPFAALPLPATGGLGDGGTGRQNSSRPVARSPRRPVALTPLIAEHEIISLPSASVLAVLRRELAGRQPAAKEVAVLADPVFDPQDERLTAVVAKAEKKTDEQAASAAAERSLKEMERSASESGGFGFARLRFTRQEAEQIASLAPAEKSLKAVDFLASRATATSPQLSQYRIVHFATHGLLNSKHPELSGLVLSLFDEAGRPQDGFLRAHEVYNLRLPAELVVLSGCQTALGKEIRGEGLVSLTRGFMYAGAARVVVSLWKVSDEATAELMKRFYQGMLRDRLRPAAALRAAQVAMRREGRWAAPYYWAAFVLQGEWK